MTNRTKMQTHKASSSQVQQYQLAAWGDLMKTPRHKRTVYCRKTKPRNFKDFLKAIKSYSRKSGSTLPNSGAILRHWTMRLDETSRANLISSLSLQSKRMKSSRATKSPWPIMTRLLLSTSTMQQHVQPMRYML